MGTIREQHPHLAFRCWARDLHLAGRTENILARGLPASADDHECSHTELPRSSIFDEETPVYFVACIAFVGFLPPPGVGEVGRQASG